jgi:tRNA(Ile2) C34 agmatinyltransferase TiaS
MSDAAKVCPTCRTELKLTGVKRLFRCMRCFKSFSVEELELARTTREAEVEEAYNRGWASGIASSAGRCL